MTVFTLTVNLRTYCIQGFTLKIEINYSIYFRFKLFYLSRISSLVKLFQILPSKLSQILFDVESEITKHPDKIIVLYIQKTNLWEKEYEFGVRAMIAPF